MIQRATIGGTMVSGRHDNGRYEGARHEAARHEAARNDGPRNEPPRHDAAWADAASCRGTRHDAGEWADIDLRRTPPAPLAPAERLAAERAAAEVADRFVDDQMFEEDVRAIASMMRPHRRERLMGWAEYRTGGSHFRATVSWDEEFQRGPQTREEQWLAVPRITEVLESILVGSLREHDNLSTAEEFDLYRGVVRELYRRLDEMQGRYE